LSAALLALSSILIAQVWSDPILRYRVQTTIPHQNLPLRPAVGLPRVADLQAVLLNDPAQGARLPEPWRSAISRSEPNQSPHLPPVLLLYVGDCATCIDVDWAQIASGVNRHNLRLRFLTSAPQEKADAFIDQVAF